MLSAEGSEGRRVFRDKVRNVSYVKGKLLGTGGFAKCYQAVSTSDGRLYAAKVIPKKSINEKRQRYKLLIEIKIHKSLKHKHIVEFIDAFEDKENIYILLEYCRNYTLKDLSKRRKRLTEFETRIYIAQIVRALIYIHGQGIIHRDLKLGNILINDQMDSKICDFGLSTRIKSEGDSKKTICGTPNYIAPEILEEQGHSYEVDIWSIGVIMYALLFGKPPFEDNTVEQTYENIKNNRYVFPPNIPVSLDAKDLINRVLVMDPARRLSLAEILDHRFMQAPEGVPHSLPLSSLAVPPCDHQKHPTRINLNDMHLELSEEIEDEASGVASPDREKAGEGEGEGGRGGLGLFIREAFRYEQSFGYLLSNGVVGCLDKQQGLSLVFEFGQEHYYLVREGQKPVREQVPENAEESPQLLRLLHFRSFFVAKYSLFKIDEMRKRWGEEQGLVWLRKAIAINEQEIVTRLSNNVIQLHFSDLTSLALNRDDDKGIYLVDKRGHPAELNYHHTKSHKLKAKVRRFSNLIQKLSPRDDDEPHHPEEHQEDEDEDGDSQEEEQPDSPSQ